MELRPPAEAGFNGTALLYKVQDAVFIAELLKRGYVFIHR